MSELELYKGMVKKMKDDEIKEKMTIGKAKKILRGFLAKDCYYDTPLYYAIPYLLDYITNLQQELEEEKRINQEDLKLIDKLEERIEKAVEYLKKTRGNYRDLHYEPIKVITLINILNGRSDE